MIAILLIPLVLKAGARRAIANNSEVASETLPMHPGVYVAGVIIPYGFGVGFVGLLAWIALTRDRPLVLLLAVPFLLIMGLPFFMRWWANRA